MIYIVGSGPAGIAAAAGLVKRGIRPVILDVGVELDPGSIAVKSRLAALEPSEWDPEDVALAKGMGQAAACGIPQKLSFGSNFAYRNADPSSTPVFRETSMLRSFARGGFSNVWGAVIQQLPSREFQRWPLEESDLVGHYQAVGAMIGSEKGAPIRRSTQTRDFYDDLLAHEDSLDRQGIRFEYASLALQATHEETGCRYCGMCLYGCPYDSIFNAGHRLKEMVASGMVTYERGVVVDRISPTADCVRIESRTVDGGERRVFDAKKVFVAAGVLETARIVLNSIARDFVSLNVAQSDIFTVPIVRYRSAPRIEFERLSTLAQIVLKIDDATVTPHPVHLQLYGYNDLYMRMLATRLGWLKGPLSAAMRTFIRRLFVAFGYLHSEISSRIRIVRGSTQEGTLRVEGQIASEGRSVAQAVVRKLFQNRNQLRALPVPFELRFGTPGEGSRIGSSFPMNRAPNGYQTNIWGALPGLDNVHIVDASVLPSVAAGPITFTAMANAHRIAFECPLRNAA
jgi:ferredoxin